MYGMAFSDMPVSLFFVKRMILFEFQPCGHALCAFRLHLKECHAEHNGCRKCGADRQRKHHRLIAGVDRDAADAYSGLFCGIFVLPVLELEELLLLLLFDGVAVGVGVDVLFVP